MRTAAGPQFCSSKTANVTLLDDKANSGSFVALAVAAILTSGSHVNGATIEAKSVSLADVQSAIGSAHEGDTVIVPSGTASWTSTLVITKGINLKGATSITGSISSPVVTDETIILDELPRRKPQNRPRRQQGPEPQQGSLEEEQPLPERQQGVQGRNAAGGRSRGAGFSRVMLCGNPEMTAEMRLILKQRGMRPCRRVLTGQFVAENYW